MLVEAAGKMMRALAFVGFLIVLLQGTNAKAATIRQLVEVVDINNVSISPNGELVAFRTEQASIERNTYRTVWYVQPVDGASPPRRLGEGGDVLPDGGGSSKPERVSWSPDSSWIVFRAVNDGKIDLWRAAVDGSRTEQITHETANVRTFAIADDGTTVFYSLGATHRAVVEAELAEYHDGIRIDPSVLLGDNLFRAGYHDGRPATQRFKPEIGYYVPLLADTAERWKSLDLSNGSIRELDSDPRPLVSTRISPLPDVSGKIVQVAEADDRGKIAILRMQPEKEGSPQQAIATIALLQDRKSKRLIECVATACQGARITSIAWRPGSEEIVFSVTERNSELQQSIFRWDTVGGDVTAIVRSAGQLVGGGRWAPEPCAVSAAALVCVASEAGAPPRLERIDLDTGTRTVRFAPNELLEHDMAEAVPLRFFAWSDAEDFRYTGQFYPAATVDGMPPPLFVVYYRCSGFLRGSVGDEWPLATFARHGIAVLCVNAAPYENDAAVRYQRGLSAVESAVKQLAARGEIDPARVGMGGLSMGAEVTMWVTTRSDLLRATSQSSPVLSPNSSLMMSLRGESEIARRQRFWQLGTPDQTPDRWRTLSPTHHLERIRAPSLMQMSEQEYRYALDYLVPLLHEQLADVYVFPDEPHQKYQPRHKLAVYQRNLDWFRFWLQGHEDPDPGKGEQYRRWRAMKVAGVDSRR